MESIPFNRIFVHVEDRLREMVNDRSIPSNFVVSLKHIITKRPSPMKYHTSSGLKKEVGIELFESKAEELLLIAKKLSNVEILARQGRVTEYVWSEVHGHLFIIGDEQFRDSNKSTYAVTQ